MRSPLELYLRALRGVTDVVEAAPSESWTSQSPCPDWSAKQLLGHVIDAQRQVAAMLAGDPPRRPVTDPGDLGRLVGADPMTTWHRTHEQTTNMLARVDLDGAVMTPLGSLSAAELLATALVEPLVHAWDLAVATGQQIVLDAEAVDAILPGVQAMGTQLAASGMYQPALSVPDSAPIQDQLLAALGRDVHQS